MTMDSGSSKPGRGKQGKGSRPIRVTKEKATPADAAIVLEGFHPPQFDAAHIPEPMLVF